MAVGSLSGLVRAIGAPFSLADPALVEMTPGGRNDQPGWRSPSGGRSAVRSGRQAVPKGREERSAVSTAALLTEGAQAGVLEGAGGDQRLVCDTRSHGTR